MPGPNKKAVIITVVVSPDTTSDVQAILDAVLSVDTDWQPDSSLVAHTSRGISADVVQAISDAVEAATGNPDDVEVVRSLPF